MVRMKAMRIRGITITLHDQVTRGTDPFGRPKIETFDKEIDNVLVGLPTTDDITNGLELYGKKAVYTLGIPKGDMHEWEDRTVTFFGQKWRTFGYSTQGIEDMIPLAWNKKIMVERYG